MRIIFLYKNEYELNCFKNNLRHFIKVNELKIIAKNFSQIVLENGVNISFKRFNVNRATDLSSKMIYNHIKFVTLKDNKNIIKEMEERLKKEMDTVYIKVDIDILNLILNTEEKLYYKVDSNTLEIEEVYMKENDKLHLYGLYFADQVKMKEYVRKMAKQKIQVYKQHIDRYKSSIADYEKEISNIEDIVSKLK